MNKSERERWELYERALNRFGFKSQLGILQEECAELIVAASKIKRGKQRNFDNFFEELADVEIMIEQIKTFFECFGHKNTKFDRTKALKLKRLEELLSGKRKDIEPSGDDDAEVRASE